MEHQAWSTLEIKSVDAEQRIVEGIASTPSVDRGGDIMDPLGAQFSLPMPFLWFHDSKSPIGEVFEVKVVPEGIRIKARVSRVSEPGLLKTFVDTAWQSFTAEPPLVRGLSIGWNELASIPVPGTKFRKVVSWLWGELSAVTIPMNTSASITSVKSIDLAASGHSASTSGVSDTPTIRARKDAPRMTTQEQITSFEAKRAANVATMNNLMLKSEGSTLDEAQREEYVTLERETESIDEHLPRLRKLEQINVKSATAITQTTNSVAASDMRGGVTQTTNVVKVTPMLQKGVGLARYAMALRAGNGDTQRTVEFAKQWRDSTPEVEMLAKAAVSAGTTTDATWAGPLALARPLVDEFLAFLRPLTLIGQNLGFTQVPFNVSVGSQTSGGAYGWVGQGLLKPVTKLDFANVTLGINKAAAIIAITEELARSSAPSAEVIVRDQMVKGIANFLDTQLLDPAVAEVAGTNPASITNGATSTASSGPTAANSRTDLVRELTAFTAAEFDLNEVVIFMNQSNAFALGIALNAFGQPLFPGVGTSGGAFQGARIITSNVVGNKMVFVHAPSILFADDGVTQIDLSREASIIMNDAPNGVVQAAGAAPIHVSLWQANMIGIRAERWITWKRARAASVRVVTAVAYTGA